MINWLKNTFIGIKWRWYIHMYYSRPKDFGWKADKPGKDLNKKPWVY